VSNQRKKDVGAIVHKSGVSFRVWAPFASSVAITGTFNNWQLTALDGEGDGYWAALIKKAKAGQEYKYVLMHGDQITEKNDPRALQLTTAAGNSVVVDPEFDWAGTTPQFIPQNRQVIYEMHIGTFNRVDSATPGTFATAMAKLDYLKDLGVTTIELMPVGSMSMQREWWGYTPEYIYAVENMYGGRHQMLEFVKAAHERGIAVILDVVYNHLGPGEDLDMWQFDGWSENGKGGIYFYNDYRAVTPWGETRPDYGRPEVRQYLLDNVRMWLHDFQLDGLRVDSTIFIRNLKGLNDDPADDLPDGWSLMQKVNSVAHKINPQALMVAEDVGVNEYMCKPVNEGGAGFYAQWQVDLPHAIRTALNAARDEERDIRAVANQLQRRFNGDAFKRVVYSDSHDSAANGAARLNEEASPGNPVSMYAQEHALVAAGIVLTMPGMPMLLQGEEFLQGGSFNDWQALEWENAKKLSGIVEAHKHLIALRKNQYGNTAGLLGQSIGILHQNDEAKVLAYHRWDQGGPSDDVVIIINFAGHSHAEYNISFPRPGTWHVRFNSSWKGYSQDFKEIAVGDVAVESSTGTIPLPPSSIIILSQDK
jgi:1,4-alpha-glucan branching enzyme